MCGYCARELNPGLIEKLRNELPNTVPTSGDTNAPGLAALINSDAAVASGELQFQVDEISFQPAEQAPAANAWGSDDAFVFDVPVPDTGNGAMASWVGRGLSNLTEQKASSLSLQTTDAPEAEFWTFNTDRSLEDWHF